MRSKPRPRLIISCAMRATEPRLPYRTNSVYYCNSRIFSRKLWLSRGRGFSLLWALSNREKSPWEFRLAAAFVCFRESGNKT
jgi:hypothetical protein